MIPRHYRRRTESDPGLLADMAKGLSRNQLDELHAALAGQIAPHHRFIAVRN